MGDDQLSLVWLALGRRRLLIVVDRVLPTYRLIQVRRSRLLLAAVSSKRIALPRQDLNCLDSHLFSDRRKTGIRLITASIDERRQIWLVDMKVKL